MDQDYGYWLQDQNKTEQQVLLLSNIAFVDDYQDYTVNERTKVADIQ